MNGIGKRFMDMTKYDFLEETPQQKGERQPPLERAAVPTGPIVRLPNPSDTVCGKGSLLDTINSRRSLRSYGKAGLSEQELSYLLWCCQGVQKKTEKHTLRTVPSAGARHALETFLLVNRVEGLQAGLYHYSALQHALAPVNLAPDITDLLTAACLGQGMVATSAITVFWAAELERMYYRYGERGFRYLHLDAGHACQNLYLAAEAIGCGACAIAAFGDNAANEALGLDGENRFLVYAATVGKKPE